MSSSIASSILEGNLTVLYCLVNSESQPRSVSSLQASEKPKIKLVKAKYGDPVFTIQISTSTLKLISKSSRILCLMLKNILLKT
ncbi:MAG: hypothetical protein ABSF24_05400 [Candidatus Bathyarchaeia archaeon]